MGEIINLRRHKKRAARDQAARDADANRVQHGRNKAERARTQEQNRKRTLLLDRHHLGEDPA
jgi:hypothetical protein